MQSQAAPLPTLCPLPVLGMCVLEQLRQLEGILADLLHWGQQKAIQRDVNHPLQQPAGLEEVHVLAELGEPGELHAGIGVVVAVLRIDLEVCLLGAHLEVRMAVACFPRQTGETGDSQAPSGQELPRFI